MMLSLTLLPAVLFQIRSSWSLPSGSNSTHETLTTADTSLTILYQNNLNATDDVSHIGAILLDPMRHAEAEVACSAIGEHLIEKTALQNYTSDFFNSLSYLEYSGSAVSGQRYWIKDGVTTIGHDDGALVFHHGRSARRVMYPVLCSQSSKQNGPDANATDGSQVLIETGDNRYRGFRNQKSFRFQGIPYADKPGRFQYSTLYSKSGQTIDATEYGDNCIQTGDARSSEDCLFLNIQTPYLPRAGASGSHLRPVLFSIHGGGFNSGNGRGTSGQDGGNFASREDIVSVQINYRLGSLGFLAIQGSLQGNYGIGDQITALRWVKNNIAAFGGDPAKITIIGDSAGAGSVRVLLGSPLVIKENLIAGGIAQSNLGGGRSLGLDGNYGTTFSSYLSIEDSYARAGRQVLQQAGCDQGAVSQQTACLQNVPTDKLINGTAATYVVHDGTIVDTVQLIVAMNHGSTAQVPVIFGTTANDGASIGSTYPVDAVTDEVVGIQQALGISAEYAQSVVDSGLFPLYDTGNLTLDSFNVSQRIATDITFRCIDEATTYAASQSGAFPRAYYYDFERTYRGYDPNGLGTNLSSGPIEPTYPLGNPNKPYFRLHSGGPGFTYGNLAALRDANDLQASQLISGYFAQFAKTGDPNIERDYLKARGYDQVLRAVEDSGPWEPVSSSTGPAKGLDAVSRTINFPELEQCAFLNYSISYYLDGGV